ncbi:MAG TPA: elongation factor P [Aggregatilineales bacterium]|nr:elongation factor P [Anaerolineales bacterium]HRE48100.1 elongation factor P [Aggregatilineales bacterium]
MIDVNDLRKGVTFTFDGALYRVLDYQHHKPGRGNATIRTTLRDLRKGSTITRTFTSGDRVQDVRVETFGVQYLYHDEDFVHFMDTTTYEQHELTVSIFGDDLLYMAENMEMSLVRFETEIIDYELPVNVEMEVVEAENAVAGNTANGASKKIKTQTGLEVQTPLFVNLGDRIKVDTRDGSYVTRIN